MKHHSAKGKVYLVGGGPGDPGLITIRGAECIAAADVVVYDYLAAGRLLDHARPDCERIYVGKKGGDHTLSQEKINALLVEKASEGKTVTRLKGGDPFIFGRGGEEAEVLAGAGIEFEIVPGVTSAIAAPAYAGIPLTHRKFTSSVAFITGHEDPAKKDSAIDWQSLARGIGTLVFLMGVRNLAQIVDRLMKAGKSPDTPVALVRWGTTSRQRTVTGCLENIVQRVRKSGIKAPAIIVVGKVVELRPTLEWFERRPLLGKRIIVTRSRAQASDLVERLHELGAECIQMPTIKVVEPDSWEQLDKALADLESFDWIVFTSVNGVDFFFRRLETRGMDSRCLAGIKTAAIGPATAKRLAGHGLNTDLIPENYRAEAVVEAFAGQDISKARILLARATEARAVLPKELKAMGAEVIEVPVYKTVAETPDAALLGDLFNHNPADMLTFTSSSTVTNFDRLASGAGYKGPEAAGAVACIGPVTAQTAEKLGYKVSTIAQHYTIDGLCEAIRNFFNQQAAL